MFAETLFFFLYRLALWPLFRLALWGLSFFNEKIRQGLAMRAPDAQGRLPWLAFPPSSRPLWIHCASGELEYAKPVITLLKKKHPELKILVTYFSPSIAKGAKSFAEIDFACPLPWETPRSLSEFIRWHEPRALLIARTDTWPEMLRQAKRAGLETLLFSATLPENSGRARGLGRWASRAAFSYLDQVFCVSSEDEKVFRGIDPRLNVMRLGDTRYDQVQARLQAPKPLRQALFQGVNRENVFVAGSTWPEDEVVLIEVAARLNERLRFILVPHEPTPAHLEAMETQLAARGLKSVRYSQASAWPDGAVLVIDQVGILAELYLQGRFAFVGGSYRKTVHSVMEPLAAGCLTFVGPKHHNNREALEFKTIPAIKSSASGPLPCVVEARDADAFTGLVSAALSAPERNWHETLIAEIKRRSGTSEKIVAWCQAFLPADR